MIQSRISVPEGFASCQSAERFNASVIPEGSNSPAGEKFEAARNAQEMMM